MSDLRKAAEMALEYFEDAYGVDVIEFEIKEALRQALAQSEQGRLREITREFVGVKEDGSERWIETEYHIVTKREWVGLTNEEIDGIYKTHHDQYGKCQTGGFEYERTIEAKLKEKNT